MEVENSLGALATKLFAKLLKQTGKLDTFCQTCTNKRSSIGMLLGYHLLWSTTANIVGNEEQADRYQKLIIENNYFIGGAVNPRDNDLKITAEGDNIVFTGFKHFNTGGVISDLTVLEGDFN